MTRYLKKLSLNARLAILFSFVAICSALNFIFINYYNSSSKSDAVVLDFAARTNLIAQKMGFYSKLIITGDEEAKELLNEQVQLFERSISMFKRGGNISGVYGMNLIQPLSLEALPHLNHMEEFWQEYKKNAQIISEQPIYILSSNKSGEGISSAQASSDKREINPIIKKAANALKFNNTELSARSNDLFEFLISESSQKQKTLNSFILYILILNIAFVVGAYTYSKKALINPLNHIADRAVKINEGDLNTTIQYYRENEIGTVGHAINKLIESMKNAREFIKNIGQGNLDVEYKGLEEDYKNNSESISGALLEMREQMRKVSNDEKERNWATEGLARFVEILRSNNDNLSLLSDNITSSLVNYINANQGGIFIINDDTTDDVHLELIACYAFETKKYIQKRINIGEGLVGQAYRENRIIYMTDIPNDYIHITSGLGGTNPTCILLVPLKVNEVSHGVIELASFHPLQPYQIDFVRKLGESIASTISTVKINERTKRLLEESQLLTQAMQAQEEAMRSSLEELMATQEEMEKKEMEITGQLTAINNTLATVQFSMDGSVINANDIFLKLTGYASEDIKGKNHKQFCDKNYANSAEYENFWQELAEGHAQTSDYKRIAKDGSELWITATYTPVFGTDGRPYKIIKLAIDITQQKIRNIDYQGQLEAINKSNAVIEFDINGKILTANPLFLSLLGYELSEITGKHHRMLIPEQEKRQDSYTEFWEQLKEGIFETGEFKHLAKDGREIWIKGSYNPILDINGHPYKVVQFAQDITREKILEAETANKLEEIQAIEEELRQNMEELTSTQEELGRKLKESEEKEIKLKSALNNIYEGIVTMNREGIIESVNQPVLKLFGYLPEEIMGNSINTFLPEMKEALLNFEEKSGTSYDYSGRTFETWGKKKDGSSLLLEIGINSSSFEGKKIITLILRDISKEKKTEESYKNLFMLSHENKIVIISDKQGKIEWANDRFTETTGYSRAEAFGREMIEFLQGPDTDQKIIEKIKKSMNKKEAFTERILNYKKSGEKYWCQMSINPVININGEIERFIALEEILEYAS